MHVPLIVNWPGQIAAGKVCPDLVDSTDFLPTLLDAAGTSAPFGAELDGRSFLPQAKGKSGSPREWIYSWYSPRHSADRTVREFAFNQDYKLYRSGEFFDLRQDLAEKRPLAVKTLDAKAARAAQVLQQAIDRYARAGPAQLDRLADETLPLNEKKKRRKQE